MNSSPGEKVVVKIHSLPGARLPFKATTGSAAYDVCCHLGIDECMQIPPGGRKAIPTGLFFEIPPGYFISLRPRSGLALKHGITLPNSPATIDSDYRGELKVILINLGEELFTVNNGDRIAQLLVEKECLAEFESVPFAEELSDTKRGPGGFGSTGHSSSGTMLT